MSKFRLSETIYSEKVKTIRGGTTVAKHGQAENGKAVKLSTADNVVLCATGDLIEGIQLSSNLESQGTVDGYAIVGMVDKGYKAVTFDGLQATPGVGAVAVGDYVVTGTVVALGTSLAGAPLKVCKATIQPGITEAAVIGDVNDQIQASKYMWRVVSLGVAGTGAVGTVGLVERV